MYNNKSLQIEDFWCLREKTLRSLYWPPFSFPLHAVLPLLQDKDLEVCAINLKVDQLETELQDLNSQESKDEASLAKVS